MICKAPKFQKESGRKIKCFVFLSSVSKRGLACGEKYQIQEICNVFINQTTKAQVYM